MIDIEDYSDWSPPWLHKVLKYANIWRSDGLWFGELQTYKGLWSCFYLENLKLFFQEWNKFELERETNLGKYVDFSYTNWL